MSIYQELQEIDHGDQWSQVRKGIQKVYQADTIKKVVDDQKIVG